MSTPFDKSRLPQMIDEEAERLSKELWYPIADIRRIMFVGAGLAIDCANHILTKEME